MAEGVDPTGDVPDGEHPDSIDLRWPQAAIAVAQNAIDKSRSMHGRHLCSILWRASPEHRATMTVR
jgi:hypothetical protein